MRRLLCLATLTLLLFAGLAGCGGGGGSNSITAATPANVFITGGDAPLPSVLGFNVTLTSIKLNGGTELLSQPQTVDFARLLGLRTLLGFNAVPAGTYNNVTVAMTSPSIAFLDLTTTPPSTSSITGTFKDAGGNNTPNATVTVSLPQPLVVTASGMTGLHLDFNLRDSLATDATGQITGVVNPVIRIKPLNVNSDEAEINDVRGGLVSVNAPGNSFVLQRPGGRQITIAVNNATNFSGSLTLATLPNPSVLEVDGHVQGDGSILATKVEVLGTERGFVSGPIIAVTPSSGAATSVTILVSEELPDLTGATVGQPATLDVSQVTRYSIRNLDNWFTNFLFNNSTLVTGQRIAIGGTINASGALVPVRVALQRQGVAGDLVLNSVVINNGNAGSFQIQNNGMLGYVLGAPLTVKTDNSTRFINVNGLSGIQSGGAMRLAAYGLVLKDTTTGAPTLYAHRVFLLQ